MIRKAPQKPEPQSVWRLAQSAELRESCSSLLRRLNWPDRGATGRAIGLTSGGHGAGVTTIAAHLAATAAAHRGQRVLLVDFHLSAPRLHQIFSVPEAPGVAEALEAEEEDAITIQSLPLENLSLLTAGLVAGAADRLYDAEHLDLFVRDLTAQFDLVIFDLPPLGRSSAAARLCGLLDGVVMIVEAERTTWDQAAGTKRQLELASARMLGVVVNNKR